MKTYGLVSLLAVLCVSAKAELLWEVPAGRAWPPLHAQSWRPDLLVRNGLPTMASAAAALKAAVEAEPGEEPLWVRLDAFDLCNVGDCETCEPPPLDPLRVIAQGIENKPLTPDQFRFAALSTAALAATRARPYLVVPHGQGPPAGFDGTGLSVLVLPVSQGLAEAAAVLSSRLEQLATWRATGAEAWPLVSDGLAGLLPEVPLCNNLLTQEAAGLGPALLVARDQSHATRDEPTLAEQLKQFAHDTGYHVEGTVELPARWQPGGERSLHLIKALLDPNVGLAEWVSPEQLALLRETDQAVEASTAWNRRPARDPGGAAELAGLLAARADHARALGFPLPATGPLSQAWLDWVRTDPPFITLTVPELDDVVIDGAQGADEWRGAVTLRLDRDDQNQPSLRPATVRLGRRGDELLAAVVAAEPVPAEATLSDRLVLTALSSDRTFSMVTATVDGRVSGQSTSHMGLADDGGRRVAGAKAVGLFEGPGWSLELSLPLAEVGIGDPHLPWRLNVATEHLRGRERYQTVWQPTFGDAIDLFGLPQVDWQ